jgi:hypothetical protein
MATTWRPRDQQGRGLARQYGLANSIHCGQRVRSCQRSDIGDGVTECPHGRTRRRHTFSRHSPQPGPSVSLFSHTRHEKSDTRPNHRTRGQSRTSTGFCPAAMPEVKSPTAGGSGGCIGITHDSLQVAASAFRSFRGQIMTRSTAKPRISGCGPILINTAVDCGSLWRDRFDR